MLRSMRSAEEFIRIGRPKPYLFAEPARLQTAPVGRFGLEVADFESSHLQCASRWGQIASPSPLKFARAAKDPWQMFFIPEFELG